MNEIKRDLYLNKLIERKENGSIKVITGIRRCGKSYLLFKLYRDYLIQNGVDESRILAVALDSEEYEALRDHRKLGAYIKERIKDDGIYYVLLDEVQLCDGFEAVLNGLGRNPSLDIYATGSNSRFLSSDILTEFRGRGDEIRVWPLTFNATNCAMLKACGRLCASLHRASGLRRIPSVYPTPFNRLKG